MVWLLVATRLEFGPNYLVNYLGGCCSGGGGPVTTTTGTPDLVYEQVGEG